MIERLLYPLVPHGMQGRRPSHFLFRRLHSLQAVWTLRVLKKLWADSLREGETVLGSCSVII